MSAQTGQPMDDPEIVEILQRKLQCLGYYDGPCNRIADDRLRQAIRHFRSAHGLGDSAALDQPTWDLIGSEAGCTFYEVLRDELAALRPGQPAQPPPAAPFGAALGSPVVEAAHRAALAGLAFSGGGVRSATFNLGILQALAQTRMLQRFDYLSTVSGGGYIGGWLSRWIAEPGEDVVSVGNKIAQGEQASEPRQIRFLRQYSNFLTPRVGLFSADTWALFATYFRNTFLNLLILGFFLAAVLMLPRLWVSMVEQWHVVFVDRFLWIGAAAFFLAVFDIALGISLLPDPASALPQGQGSVIWLVVLPLMVASAAGSVGLWQVRDVIAAAWQASHLPPFHLPETGGSARENWLALILVGPGVVYFVAWAAGWAVAQGWNLHRRQRNPALAYIAPRHLWLQGLGHFLFAVGALAVGTALIVACVLHLPVGGDVPASDYLAHLATFGMPFLLSIFGIAMVLLIGLIGRLYSDRSREWWSRQGGWTVVFVFVWTMVFLFAMYGPVLVVWICSRAPGWASGLLAGGLGTTWASLWAARSPATGRPGSSRSLEWLAMCGPPLAAVAILTAVASAIYFTVPAHAHAPHTDSFAGFLHEQMFDAGQTSWQRLVRGLLVCSIVFLVFAFRVDVNKFSLYTMYRNRLVRAYLGAINPRRMPHPFTGFDSNDDVALRSVGGRNGRIQRPYLISNAALNLVKGKELAWQTRKAANFAFTPRFCGYETPRMSVSTSQQSAAESGRGLYRRTESFGIRTTEAEETEKGVKLGMAMAISGAAASPSMGYHSSPALTFLMTLFNIRLGRWCGNPATRNGWKKASPPAGFYHIFKELLGFTDASSNFLYLSDGGHFENLGMYELVRRRCRLIVAVDVSADSQLSFGDLGNAVRKCYTDFNIEIDINVKNIELAKGSGFSSAYCVAGKIRYSTVHPGAPDGTLLYIKPSLLGTEFVEILNYRKTNPSFPHQSTSDQWFDETQFESYRSLGNHIGKAIFSRLTPGAGIEQLCAAIESDWLAGQAGDANQGRPMA